MAAGFSKFPRANLNPRYLQLPVGGLFIAYTRTLS
jgi:hypothetical protein